MWRARSQETALWSKRVWRSEDDHVQLAFSYLCALPGMDRMQAVRLDFPTEPAPWSLIGFITIKTTTTTRRA